MAEFPDMTLPTIKGIYQSYVDHNSDWRRNHLGASLIGTECSRSIWYSFRWATNPNFDGRMLRLFESGNCQEPRIIKNLRDIGCEVFDVDPETGKQINFSMFGGHYAGSCDAIAQGFKESKKWHLVEVKTANTKSFNSLNKYGIEKSKPIHYYQCQQYMGWFGLERAYYFCVCKDTDEIYGERVYFDKEVSKVLEAKAERIIFSDVAPFGVEGFSCKFCQHQDVCKKIKLPEVNCRTCAMVTPERNGTWTCSRDKHILCSTEQRSTQYCHVFNPCFIAMEPTDSDAEKGTISYGNIINGPGETPSTELQDILDKVASGEIEV